MRTQLLRAQRHATTSSTKRCSCCVVTASSSVAVAHTTIAADPAQKYPLVDVKQQTKELRTRLCKEVLAGGLIYLSGGDLRHRNGSDVYYKFRPNSNFVYLTGVQEPGFAALIDPETLHFTLIAPKVPENAAVWWGGLPSLEEMAENAGADACIYAEDLQSFILQHHAELDTLHVLQQDLPELQQLLQSHPLYQQHQPQQQQQYAALQAVAELTHCHVSSAFLENTLNRCRAHKTTAEIACLLAASQGSAAAHRAIWQTCRPGLKEYQLEAAFVAAAGHAGLTQLGYPCIVGAGRNAAILHYERNNATVGQNDLVLVDAGAEYNCYTADITRTFPASGVFSAQQKDIYDLVLLMQQHALDLTKPGAAWADIQLATRRLLLDGLVQLGLVKGSLEGLTDAGIDKVFMPHGLGHFLGLDVHDVSDVGPVPKQLEEGHVVTVEPGCYFMPLLVQQALADSSKASCLVSSKVEEFMQLGGVRIEDNVFVTGSGHFNLTTAADMPKSTKEIEVVMAGRN